MTTQAHPAPTGTSHRQCPAEGFTCYQPLEDDTPSATPVEAIAAVCGLLAVVLFVLFAATAIYVLMH